MKYDLAVVGGGIIGAGVARDAALRGLKVALFDKEDWGAGTTSRSTRLIHGGLRYLQHYDFGLVHEALKERRLLLRLAPHLVQPLPFLLPVYRDRGHSVPVLWTGITVYDYLSFRRAVPHHRFLPPGLCRRLEPTLKPEGLRGGFLFYDAQCAYPERLCLENVLDAIDHGAHARNHARVTGLEVRGGEVVGVRVRDELTGVERRVGADLVLNCAGPWLDDVERLAAPDAPPQLRRTKGIHLVVPRFTQHALILEAVEEDRVVFAIPWGENTLIGTTDTDYDGDSDDVRADSDDVDYLLRQLSRVLNHPVARRDVLYTTAGLRPLKRVAGRTTAALSRRHEILDHEALDGVRGYASLVGGKITTYRHVAEEVVDFAVERLGRAEGPCRTAREPLPGGRLPTRWSRFVPDFIERARAAGVPADVARHLADQYGADAERVLARARGRPELARRIQPEGPWIWAQVVHAVRREGARTLTDVLLRRLTMGLSAGQGRAAAPRIARVVGSLLGWGAGRRQAEVRNYRRMLDRNWSRPR